MPKNYSNMSVEELEQESYRLDEERAKVRAEQLAVQEALTNAITKADAERKVANMSDAEKQALVQTIKTQGITSAERVSNVG